MKNLKNLFTILVLSVTVIQALSAVAQKWYIVLDKPLASDVAIQVAIDDLNKAGETFGIQFIKTTKINKKYPN